MLQGTNIGRHFFLERSCWNPCSSAYREKKKENTAPPPHRASTDRPLLPCQGSLVFRIPKKRESGTRDVAPHFPLVLGKLRRASLTWCGSRWSFES